MASYLEMQKRKRDREVAEKEKINELNVVNDEAINENLGNTITVTGMTLHTYVEELRITNHDYNYLFICVF